MHKNRPASFARLLSRPFRLRRFSLRTLFVLITLCSLAFGAWSIYVDPYRRQASSLAEVNRLQGVVSLRPAEGPAWTRWLVTYLLGDSAFVYVDKVDLSLRNVHDPTLRSLTGLKYLTDLNLDFTQVSDEGLSAIRAMPSLTSLSLRYTNISDDGIFSLSSLPNLNKLIVTGTKISDSSVALLAKMPSLTELYLRWTQVSNAGAEKLADEIPRCAIFHHALTTEVASVAP